MCICSIPDMYFVLYTVIGVVHMHKQGKADHLCRRYEVHPISSSTRAESVPPGICRQICVAVSIPPINIRDMSKPLWDW